MAKRTKKSQPDVMQIAARILGRATGVRLKKTRRVARTTRAKRRA